LKFITLFCHGQAYYALVMIGGMKKGESVLIHSGSGGVGLAAINVCLHAGCTVYTTVGTKEKREFIKKQYPQVFKKTHHLGRGKSGRCVYDKEHIPFQYFSAWLKAHSICVREDVMVVDIEITTLHG
jgi:NADPH:quinone reductase-like Zn-dependent oxidoreductase